MRVLFITNMWPDEARPAYGIFIKTQADGLRAIGVDVDVMSIRGYANRWAYLGAAARASRLNMRDSYDVVHAHYGHSAAIARLQVRAPLVVSYCGDDLFGTPSPGGSITLRSRVEAAVFRQLAWVSSATITKSRDMERYLPEPCRRRNHVIPNGVDLGRFCLIGQAEARRRLGWDHDEQAILFVGNPRRFTKNFALAEEVCRKAREALPRARLRVAWEVPPTELPMYFAAADALLFTSRVEGSPNTVKEAMASKLPVVSTPVGDVPERLEGLPGCFVRPSDAASLAEVLPAAVCHGRVPEARERISELSLSGVAHRVLEVYEHARAR